MESIEDSARWSPDDKMLIIHADDLGMAHSVNVATFEAFDCGAISSASVMMPCPWLAEVIGYAGAHPSSDIGIHLTVTSEWQHYKWRPLLRSRDNAGLTDSMGYFRVSPELIEASAGIFGAELREQLDLAKANGLRASHVDMHMFAGFMNPKFALEYVKVAMEVGLPCILPRTIANRPRMDVPLAGLKIESVFHAAPDTPPNLWKEHYLGILRSLKPGLNELIVHLGYDDSELREIMKGKTAWGSAWRQRDFDVVVSPEFKAAIQEYGIRVINWQDAKELLL
jgi:chitin disaccharide deacetylase